MNANLGIRLVVMLLLLTTSVTPLFAQDEEEGDDNWGDFGLDVGGLAEAADVFDVPAQPTQETAQQVFNVTPLPPAQVPPTATQQASNAAPTPRPPWEHIGSNSTIDFSLELVGGKRYQVTPKIVNTPHTESSPARQGAEVIWEDIDNRSGSTITMYSDNSVEIVDSSRATVFTGRCGLSHKQEVILVGSDPDGNQFAFDDGYMIALSVDGDVLLGDSDGVFTFDYDDDGNFLGLWDSDGNVYDVEVDENGNVFITDAEGNRGEFLADGTYALYDDAGTFLVGDELFGDDEEDEDFFDAEYFDAHNPGYGEDYGYGDDEGYGGDQGYADDYGYGDEGDYGDQGGYGDDEAYGGDESYGDEDGYGDD